MCWPPGYIRPPPEELYRERFSIGTLSACGDNGGQRLLIFEVVNTYRVVMSPDIVRMVVVTSAPPHGSVLVPCPALAGHWSVQRAVEVGGRVRASVTRRHGLGHEVRLLPSRLAVHVPQLLVLPHGEQHLAGELDHPAAVLGPLSRHVHQPVHATSL